MQLKLSRREDVTISSWINDRPITTADWEVYSQEDSGEGVILLVLIDKKTNNQVKIELKKYTRYENVETSNS
jgi:hypothetical protein